MNPDELFIQQAITDSRCSRRDIDISSISESNFIQARVLSIDDEHCERLKFALEEADNLSPIVVFRCARNNTLYLADGIHRHKAYLLSGRQTIPANIIDSSNAALEALEYATMCNRRLCLPRTKKDLDKAIEMLLSNQSWWGRVDVWIARHVGCGAEKVARIRNRICLEKNISVPEKLERSNGACTAKSGPLKDSSTIEVRQTKHSLRGTKSRYSASSNGKSFYGPTERIVKTKIKTYVESVKSRRENLEWRNFFRLLSLKYGFKSVFDRLTPGVRAVYQNDAIYCPCALNDPGALPLAVGCLVAAEEFLGGPRRKVIVCCVEDGNEDIIDIYKRCGYEFVSLEDLISSLVDRVLDGDLIANDRSNI